MSVRMLPETFNRGSLTLDVSEIYHGLASWTGQKGETEEASLAHQHPSFFGACMWMQYGQLPLSLLPQPEPLSLPYLLHHNGLYPQLWFKTRFRVSFFFLQAFYIVPVCLCSAKLFKVSLVPNFLGWDLTSTSVHDFRTSFLSFSNLFFSVSSSSTVYLAGLCIAAA